MPQGDDDRWARPRDAGERVPAALRSAGARYVCDSVSYSFVPLSYSQAYHAFVPSTYAICLPLSYIRTLIVTIRTLIVTILTLIIYAYPYRDYSYPDTQVTSRSTAATCPR